MQSPFFFPGNLSFFQEMIIMPRYCIPSLYLGPEPGKHDMNTRLLFLSLILFLFLFPVLALIPSLSPAEDSKPDQSLARHTLSISFDLKKSLITGTSKIDLPKNIRLELDCGPLTITGAVLEQKNHTPVQIKPGKKGRISIAKLPQQQTLFLSWILKVTNPYASNNLISTKGITLAGFWHPIADQDMLFELHAELPQGFTAVSEGEQVSIKKQKKTWRYKASFPHPLQAMHFAAGPYSVRSRKLGDVTIYSYFFKEDQKLAVNYLKKAAGYIKRYQSLIGPFPYSRYSIVENRLPTGFGMPGFTLLGQAVVRLPFIKDTSLGHEILHSWFGNSIGLADFGGNWCEGLTTYLADQSFAADKGEGTQYRKNQILRYLSYVHPDNTMPLTDFNGAGDGQPMARKIRAIGYDKASMVFHMLKGEIGEKNFIQGLRKFYATKKHQRASWQDINHVFSKVSGRDLSSFFEQWLERGDIPRLRLQQLSVEQKNGQSVTSFHLVQENQKPYRLQIPIILKSLTGETRKTVNIDQPDQEVSLTTDILPTEIIFDPDYTLLRHLSEKEIPPTWSRFMGADKKTVILPDDEQQAAIYQPLADMLQRQGALVRKAGKITNKDLTNGNYLFAGTSPLRQSLFAEGEGYGEGFKLTVRKNPLSIKQTMVLVDSSSLDETRAAARKLSHYGKYGFLRFMEGKLLTKRIEQTTKGEIHELITPPAGVATKAVQDFPAIMNAVGKSRVIYVGETHTAYGDHILQLQVLQALYKKNKNLTIGMEMFPRTSQAALDGYINGKIPTEKEFLKKAKYFSVWGFDYRLYRDIIGFAKEHRIPIIGLNLDKKIVSKVFAEGSTDTITKEEKKQLPATRDLDVPGYRERLRTIYGQHAASPHGGHKKFSGFLQAQAIWDETMAESIANYLQTNPEAQMVIIAGAGHVYKDSAIPLRVERRIPGIGQSVLVADNGMDTGKETGKKVDYLLFTEPMEPAPAPKIGVMLEEEKAAGKKGRVVIVGISPHGNGIKAGLKEGDTILSLDDNPVHDIADLKIALLDKAAGDTVILKVFRQQELLEDETLEIPVELTGMRMDMMMPPGHPQK
jgi:uncharacterized iron-regulated protein